MFLPVYSLLVGAAYFQQSLVWAQKLELELCDKFASANSTVVPFSYSNNAWGNITGLATGYQCTKIYDEGRSWTATYQWSGDPTVVKAYPRMRAWPSNMPFQLRSLSQLLVNVNFKTFTTNGGDNDAAYTSAGLVANVAMDLFVAPTAEGAIQVSPPTEIMIWPWWTPTILPLGYTSSTPEKDTIEVNGATWSLYHGINDGGQNVFSWLARSNVTSLNGDYAPLVTYLIDNNYMSGDMWASQLQLGQEMKVALQETNFQVDASELRVVRSDEGEISVAAPAPATSTSLLPVSESAPATTSLPPSSTTDLTTATTGAPTQATTSAVPITTSTIPPSPSPQTTLSTTDAPAPVPESSTTVESSESPGPAPITTAVSTLTTTSVAPAPASTTSSEAPEAEPTTVSTSIRSSAPTTTASTRSTTSPRANTTTMTATISDASSTTAAAATTTTSNAATTANQVSRDSWFMLMVALVAGLL